MDENGIPRRWTPGTPIAEIYKKAKDRAEKLINIFCYMQLETALGKVEENSLLENEDDPNLIINSNKKREILRNFNTECEASYSQACREQVPTQKFHSKIPYTLLPLQETLLSHGSVPMYMIILIVILGFNEFVYILTNPLLLLVVLLLGAAAFVLNSMGALGPTLRMVRN